MRAALLDTDVLLAYREADDTAVEFVQRIRAEGPPQISQASVLALLRWPRDEREQTVVDDFIGPLTIHTVTAFVSRKAVAIMRGLKPPCRLTPVDGLVAATAVLLKLPLYALDPERYAAVPGLTALPAR
jgi:predicted nucleic acid-binding protein